MKKIVYITLIAFCYALLLSSCKDYLDITPKGKKVPSTLADYRAFMENNSIRTQGFVFSKSYLVNEYMPPSLAQLKSDHLNWINYQWVPMLDRIDLTETDANYDENYKGIYYANLILNEVPGIAGENPAEAQEIMAQAKVLRAIHYFYLVNTYAKAYDPATAATDGGVPYITSADDFQSPIPQLTVAQVYQNMLTDLTEALPYLPEQSASYMQPNKAAGYAMLARVQLFMRDFDGALESANQALARFNEIFDLVAFQEQYAPGREVTFPDASQISVYPTLSVAQHGGENILLLWGKPIGLQNSANLPMLDSTGAVNYVRDTTRFEPGDTRFLTNYYKLSNFYTYGRSEELNAGGLRTTEQYLIRAECYARKGDATSLQLAMNDLNAIRKKRIVASKYHNKVVASTIQAMDLIRHERDIELFGSDMMFYDMRRFNTEDAYKKTMKKVDIDGITRILEPDSELWIMPFPKSATKYNPLLKQNTSR